MKKLFRKRKKDSKNFKRFCKMGLYINLIFLGIFLSSIFYLGLGAFKQTYIYTKADKNSLAYELLSRSEQRQIRANQAQGEGWFLANAEVDQYVKNNYHKLNESQIQLVNKLMQKNQIQLKFNTNFFFNGDSKSPENSGVFSSVVGTLLVMVVCMVVSIPIGVGAAIYLEEFAPQNLFTHFIEVCINNLASIPSILFGLLGLGVFINLFGMPRSSALAGGLTLAIMSLPIIIVSTKAALKSVDINMKNAAYALGMTKYQMIKGIILPLAMPMILTGSILTLAGAIGETAPLMIIGMIAFIPDVATSIFSPTSVLPAQIFSWSAMPERAFLERTAAGILVLLGLLVILNLSAILLRKYFQGKKS